MIRLPAYVPFFLAGSALLLSPLTAVLAADGDQNDGVGSGTEQAAQAAQAAVTIDTPFDGFETLELTRVRFAPGPIVTGIKPDADAADRKTGFLYFHKSNDPQEERPDLTLSLGNSRNTPFTPRFGEVPVGATEGIESFLTPGEAWLLSTFTPRYANAHISLTYGRSDEESARKALGIELSSSLRVRQVDMPGVAASPSLAEALASQQYNVGLKIGYLGFNLGASMRSETGQFGEGIKGYDVGLSYRGSSWSTSLSVGEYSRRRSGVFSDTEDLENTYYAFDVGASYSFSRAFSLTGGFRHFEYGRSNILDADAAPRSQIFYLGTRLNF